ncbi:hypothetical protein LNW73_13750 [Streptomyces sp. RKAG337]|nr:hypothetical protein [Streptomyces sp. RKAG337]
MSDGWRWECVPDGQLRQGVPAHVVAEAEQIAVELVALADLAIDITDLGTGPRPGQPGGVRRFDLPSGGWVDVLPVPRACLVAVVLIMPPMQHL